MSRSARSFCIVGAIVAMLFALTAPAFAGGCNGCAQQVQAVYAQPVIQPLAVVQPYYAQPLIQRQVIRQSYVQPVIQQQVYAQPVVLDRVRFAPSKQRIVNVQRVKQPRVQRQVIRSRNVQSIQVGY
jgi:hypothetical protein